MTRTGGCSERPPWEEIGRLYAPSSSAGGTIPRLGGTVTLDYLQACAGYASEPPANLDPWLPWSVDKTRLERMRHSYPVQPHGP